MALPKLNIGIIGKGALGLLYASIASKSDAVDSVAFVMDESRYERHKDEVSQVNDQSYTFDNVCVAQAKPVDLVIFAVKSTGIDSALPLIKPLLGEKTRIISVLNGIISENKIAEIYGWDRIVPTVAYGMDAERTPTGLHYTHEGYLRIGKSGKTNTVQDELNLLYVADCLEKIGAVHQIDKDIWHSMWAKFMANAGVNQVTAAWSLTYSQLLADTTSEEFRTYIGAMREVMAIGRAEGIDLTEKDMNDYIDVLRALDPDSWPSMAQDRAAHRPSEVDQFAGLIVNLGIKHDIQTPCNAFLLKRIKDIESTY